MSVSAVSWVLESTQGFSAARRMVLVCAADYAGEGEWVWASLGTLAKRAGCSEDTARRALQDAVAEGWLVEADYLEDAPAAWRELRADRRPNLYRFTLVRGSTQQPRSGETPARGSTSAIHGVAPLLPKPNKRTLREESLEARDSSRRHEKPTWATPWFVAVEDALQQPVPPAQDGLVSRLAAKARRLGHDPGLVVQAAAVIADKWGLDKLTLGSLEKHYEWALSPLRQRTPDQVEGFRRRLADEAELARIREGALDTATRSLGWEKGPGDEAELQRIREAALESMTKWWEEGE